MLIKLLMKLSLSASSTCSNVPDKSFFIQHSPHTSCLFQRFVDGFLNGLTNSFASFHRFSARFPVSAIFVFLLSFQLFRFTCFFILFSIPFFFFIAELEPKWLTIFVYIIASNEDAETIHRYKQCCE